MTQPNDISKVDNPWRKFIENCINGDNYFRGSEYRELLADLDRGYQAEAQVATLARQLAEAKAENGRLMTIAGWGGLAGDAPERLILASEAYDGISCCDKWIDVRRVTDGEQPIPASATAYVRADLHEQAESQLAEATRRLGEVEGLLREAVGHMTRGRAYYSEYHDFIERIAALTKEPTK